MDHVEDLAEVDEALRHAQAVPEAERGLAWQRWVDSLLDKRARLQADGEQLAPTFSS